MSITTIITIASIIAPIALALIVKLPAITKKMRENAELRRKVREERRRRRRFDD